jgi:hypothetical protein
MAACDAPNHGRFGEASTPGGRRDGRPVIIYALTDAAFERAWKLLRSFCSLGGITAMQ